MLTVELSSVDTLHGSSVVLVSSWLISSSLGIVLALPDTMAPAQLYPSNETIDDDKGAPILLWLLVSLEGSREDEEFDPFLCGH